MSHAFAGAVHLVGSLPPSSIEDVFETAARELADTAIRLPDGEAGGWVNIPIAALAGLPEFERLPLPPGSDAYMRPPLRLKDGVSSDGVAFAPTGYVEISAASYAVFKALKSAGKIAPQTRFQVSLPTPFAALAMAFVESDVLVLLPRYEAFILGEVAAIAARIPHAELAIQWDAAVEVVEILERHRPSLAALFSPDDVAAHLARLCNALPGDVEAGIHLCYGNPNGKHVLEPADTGVMAEFVNLLLPKLRRPLAWLHMPVPIDRDDADYFSPLKTMPLPAETQLFLGLMHLGDGLAGAQRRLAAAQTAASHFGVSTECGMRLVPKTDVGAFLALQRDVARLVR
jgi:hypothetical protein